MSIVITILIFRMNWEWIFFNLFPDYRDSQVILLITYCWSSEYIRNSCLEYNPKTQYFIFLKIITIIQGAREMMDSGLTVPWSKELRLFVKQRPSCNSLSLNPISPDVTGASSSLPLPLRVPRVSIIHGEPTAAHWIDLRALYTGSRVENSPGSITEQVVTTMLGHSYLVISIYADERWALVHHEGTHTDSKCLIFETILLFFSFFIVIVVERNYEDLFIELSITVSRILKWLGEYM